MHHALLVGPSVHSFVCGRLHCASCTLQGQHHLTRRDYVATGNNCVQRPGHTCRYQTQAYGRHTAMNGPVPLNQTACGHVLSDFAQGNGMLPLLLLDAVRLVVPPSGLQLGVVWQASRFLPAVGIEPLWWHQTRFCLTRNSIRVWDSV